MGDIGRADTDVCAGQPAAGQPIVVPMTASDESTSAAVAIPGACACGHEGHMGTHLKVELRKWMVQPPRDAFAGRLLIVTDELLAHDSRLADLLVAAKYGPIILPTLKISCAYPVASKPDVPFDECRCGFTGGADAMLDHARMIGIACLRDLPRKNVGCVLARQMEAEHGPEAVRYLRSQPVGAVFPKAVLSSIPSFHWKMSPTAKLHVQEKAAALAQAGQISRPEPKQDLDKALLSVDHVCRCGHVGPLVIHMNAELSRWMTMAHPAGRRLIVTDALLAHDSRLADLLVAAKYGPIILPTLKISMDNEVASKPDVPFVECRCGFKGGADAILDHARMIGIVCLRALPVKNVGCALASQMEAEHGPEAVRYLRSHPVGAAFPDVVFAGVPSFQWTLTPQAKLQKKSSVVTQAARISSVEPTEARKKALLSEDYVCRCGHVGLMAMHMKVEVSKWMELSHPAGRLLVLTDQLVAHDSRLADLLVAAKYGPIILPTLKLLRDYPVASKPDVPFDECRCGFKGGADAMLEHAREIGIACLRKLPVHHVGCILAEQMVPQHGPEAAYFLRNHLVGSLFPISFVKATLPFYWQRHASVTSTSQSKAVAKYARGTEASTKAEAQETVAGGRQTKEKRLQPSGTLPTLKAMEALSSTPQPLTGVDAERVTEWVTSFPALAVDLEGNLDEGDISLIQLAVEVPGKAEALTFLIDGAVMSPALVSALRRCLAESPIPKVLHDGRCDLYALKQVLGITVNPIFDTSAYADMVVEMETGEKPLLRTGLNALLARAKLPHNPHKEAMEHQAADGSSVWKQRPLPLAMQEYARGDVLHLLALRRWLQESMEAAIGKAMSKQAREMLAPDASVSPHRVTEEPSPLSFSEEVNSFLASFEQQETEDDFLSSFLELFSPTIAEEISAGTVGATIEEVSIDEGCPIYVRTNNGSCLVLDYVPNAEDIDELLYALNNGEEVPWTEDNRFCVPGCLHRVARLLAIDDQTVGLTYRLGRHVASATHLLGDLVYELAVQLRNGHTRPNSLLLLGQPGAGKTTILRQMAALLGEEHQKRVIVVDTSLEIAGGGHKAHGCIGQARRVQVKSRKAQGSLLVQVVQNHSPKVVIVDEISEKVEANAIKNIGQRGVAVVATAHGNLLGDLLRNRELVAMVGGVHAVMLSAGEAKARGAAQKTVQERMGGSAFQVLVEIVSYTEVYIIRKLPAAIDRSLKGRQVVREHRWLDRTSNTLMCQYVTERRE